MTLHFLRNLGLMALAGAGGLAAATVVIVIGEFIADNFGLIGGFLAMAVAIIILLAVLKTYAERSQKS